ncbi:transcription elongation regulator [Thoreauomyces humboldtii]|nr:transcription elongation regulator [Thoreauomyces humboldtii]
MDPLDPEHTFKPPSRPAPKQVSIKDVPGSSEIDLHEYDYSVRAPSPPPPAQFAQHPPLWTQHRDAAGRAYFHNAMTKESRWDQPPDFRAPPPPPPPFFAGGAQPLPFHVPPVVQQAPAAAEAKEHVLAMKIIPSTPWSIVLTNCEHEFFYNADTRESLWDMPDDLGELMGQLIVEAMGMGDDVVEELVQEQSDGDGEQPPETSRGRSEDADAVHPGEKRKAANDPESASNGKRARVEDVPSQNKPLPGSADASPAEDGTAEFLNLLREADVSPYTTWEKELPKIIDDPRYGVLATLKERKSVFDQYCIARVSELREAKAKATPREIYLQILKDNTTARTRWDDFNRKFKRDKRFTSIDAKEREKLFKAHIANLKGKGGTEASKIEMPSYKDEFHELLKETVGLTRDSSWRQTSRELEDDPRYRAVRSSSEREDLFRQYVRRLDDVSPEQKARDEAEKRDHDRKAREAAAVRDREMQARREMSHLSKEVTSHRHNLQSQDARSTFQTLLVNTVRDTAVQWSEVRPHLERDPLWARCDALDDHQKQMLFSNHLRDLHQRLVAGFHAALKKTTEVATVWEDVRGWILQDPRTLKLAADPTAPGFEELVRREFETFQEERLREARRALSELLAENNFLKFHVKQAVADTRATALDEGKTDSKEGDEWGFISLAEIGEVLNVSA